MCAHGAWRSENISPRARISLAIVDTLAVRPPQPPAQWHYRRGSHMSHHASMQGAAASAERERIGLHARIEELDLERAVGDLAVLPHQLVEALAVDRTLAVGIGVGAVVGAGRLAVDGHAEADGLALGRRAEHEMEVAGVEAVDDAAALLVERGV